MDYHNDADFREYYESMMHGSPAESLGHPGYNHISPEEAPASSGDYFYDAVGHGVSYEDDEAGIMPPSYGYEETSPAAAPAATANAGGGKKTKKSKQKRDPNKPKGCMSAVLMYSNAHRARCKAENPNASFGDIARLLSAEYKSLSPEDSALWQKASEDDRARYKHEMESYVPPGEFSGYGYDNGSSKNKKKKDPNAPKNKRSAWQFFSSGEHRKTVLEQHPGTSINDVMRILGQQWKALTAQERASFDEMAVIDKARYEREMAAYKARNELPEVWQD